MAPLWFSQGTAGALVYLRLYIFVPFIMSKTDSERLYSHTHGPFGSATFFDIYRTTATPLCLSLAHTHSHTEEKELKSGCLDWLSRSKSSVLDPMERGHGRAVNMD